MLNSIQKVVIAGATGNLGSVVLNKLVDSGKFSVTVLRREGPTSSAVPNINTVYADFNSVESLAAALFGQDALIVTLSAAALHLQKNLIDAAIAAGIHRILPSEFGSNLDNGNTRSLAVFAPKVQIQEYLISKAVTTPLTYTFLYNSALLDFGLQSGFLFDMSKYKPTIFNGGEAVFSATTMPTVGDAVISILLHLEETKNRSVYIESVKVTQNELLGLAKQVAPEKPWQPHAASFSEVISNADARLAQQIIDDQTIFPYVWRSIMDPNYGGNFRSTDNKLLGLKESSRQDIIEIIRKCIL
ncbi:hypothetical protein NQ176_g1486 [Zarea fungicola]|uniref:Uncharacterized protein n=1 Tax=Zarea fungicola TaxID=93591 RepID=A0ACC1NTN0_9HYPO|nr:hypothetical protein NQ176_g1486 [Lecanicillium fungicola]